MQEYRNATVVLVSDCMGRPRTEQSFPGQIVRVASASAVTSMGLDGHRSVGGLPQEIYWLQRTGTLDSSTTQIQIKSESGPIVASGELNTNRQQESSFEGLRFWLSPAA